MFSISISKTASKKILEDRDRHTTLLGRHVIPFLIYYQKSYSTLNDGTIIELGSGLTLSFIEHVEVEKYELLPIDLGSDCTLMVGPSTLFQDGMHSNDWVDRKFELNRVG